MAKSYHDESKASTSSETFTKIPNDILEALCRTKLSSYEIRALFVIVRMTWGWQKESDTISHKQISDMTGIDRRNIFRVLEGLADRQIVAIHRDGRMAPTYRINKSFAQWRLPSSHMAAPKRVNRRLAAVPLHGNVPSVHMADVPSPQTADLPCEGTRSKESSKETKENERNRALRAASYDGSLNSDLQIKDSDPEEASKRKELSAYRNKMAKSRLYSDDELFSFRDKSIEQLREIDTARFLEKHPHLAAPNTDEQLSAQFCPEFSAFLNLGQCVVAAPGALLKLKASIESELSELEGRAPAPDISIEAVQRDEIKGLEVITNRRD